MAIIAFAVMAVFCGMANQYLLLMVCVAMVGLLGPFLFRNVLGWRVGWRKLFFGDTGGLTEHFVYTVRSLERLGVSAVIIEDKKGLKKNSLFFTIL